jgi:hypothetical protein
VASVVKGAPTAALLGILAISLILLPGCNPSDDSDTTAPVVGITFPPEDSDVLSDIATIRVDARDNVGIRHVIFMADGDTLERITVEPYTLEWNTTAYPDCTDTDSFVLLTVLAEDFSYNDRSTERRFYLDNEGLPPIPVELIEPASVTKHSVSLSWEESVDYDFSHYLLRRDTTENVTNASDSLARFDLPESTTYTDADTGISPFGLLEDTEYSYRIYVHDVFGRSTGSDSILTAQTLLPAPVRLRATAATTKYTAGLEWDLSSEDVAYYRLHRGPTPQETDLDSIAAFVQGTTSYTDSALTANSTYYYYLYIVDEAGYSHHFWIDDVLELQTLALPTPELADPATNITKYQATMSWTQIPEQEDSSWIALYRSTRDFVDSTDLLLHTGPRNDILSLTDHPLQQGWTYRYRLRHWDSQNNITWSNTLAVTTQHLAEIWGGGLGVSDLGKYALTLTWDRYSYPLADDFAGYILQRDGEEIFTSSQANDNQFPDDSRAKNTTYHYRLTLTDTSGTLVEDTLSVSTRDILPAEIVDLVPTENWYYQLAWLPSEEPDSEFDRYELLRSRDAAISFTDLDGDNTADCVPDGDCVQVTTISERLAANSDTLTYLDTDATLVDTALATLPIYQYVVLTYDRVGGYVRSNIVGDTLYSPPSPVQLRGPNEHGSVSKTSIRLEWDQAAWPTEPLTEWLFSRYEIWRYEVSGQQPWEDGPAEQMVHTSDGATTYSDGSAEVQEGAFWFYAVVVRDIFGQGAASNEVEGFTSP